MLKHIYIGLFLTFNVSCIFAQTIDRQVVGSSGTQLSSGSTTVEFTIGEAVTETVSSVGHSASQGFHQGTINVTSIEEDISFGEVSVFPNPAVEAVQVKYQGSTGQWHLYTIDGKLVSSGRLQKGLNSIDLNRLAQATYILNLFNQKDIRSTYRVQKIL